MKKLVCDGGCGTEWIPGDIRQPEIAGQRREGRGGGGIDVSGEFHWCYPCAAIAFIALEQARGSDAPVS